MYLSRQTEVKQFDIAIFVDNDIARLDIPVQNLLTVSIIQRISQLFEDVDYRVVYDMLDVNCTGVTIEMTIAEVTGECESNML